MDREQYEKDLRERQKRHLENVRKFNVSPWSIDQRPWQACMHDMCSNCYGTGIRIDGSSCVHLINCPCPRCNPWCTTQTSATYSIESGWKSTDFKVVESNKDNEWEHSCKCCSNCETKFISTV